MTEMLCQGFSSLSRVLSMKTEPLPGCTLNTLSMSVRRSIEYLHIANNNYKHPLHNTNKHKHPHFLSHKPNAPCPWLWGSLLSVPAQHKQQIYASSQQIFTGILCPLSLSAPCSIRYLYLHKTNKYKCPCFISLKPSGGVSQQYIILLHTVSSNLKAIWMTDSCGLVVPLKKKSDSKMFICAIMV